MLGIGADPLADLARLVAGRRLASPRSGGTSASPSCSSWPRCRTSRATSTRRPPSTAPAACASFWHVTLPHLRPAISMVVTLQLIATLRIFSQVYVMTNGGPAAPRRRSSTTSTRPAIVQQPARLRLGRRRCCCSSLILAVTIAAAAACCGSARVADRRAHSLEARGLAWRDLPLWLARHGAGARSGARPSCGWSRTSFKPSGAGDDQRDRMAAARGDPRQLRQGVRIPGRAPGRMNSVIQATRRHRPLRAVRRHGRLCAGAPALSRPRRCCSCCSSPR